MKPKTMGKTAENGDDGSLKTGPITPGPKPKGQFTIWTTIPPKKQSLDKTIEKRLHKPMPPNPALAPGTTGRSRPGETLPLLENLLDVHIHLQ